MLQLSKATPPPNWKALLLDTIVFVIFILFPDSTKIPPLSYPEVFSKTYKLFKLISLELENSNPPATFFA